MKEVKPIKILLADAQYLVRMGLRHIVSRDDALEVVGESSGSDELQRDVKELAPDVVMLDYNSEEAFELDDIARIKAISSNTHVLVISADESKENINRSLELGVNSYLTKQCDREEILNAIFATAKGQRFYCNKVLDIILEKHLGQEVDCKPTALTAREVEIVKLIAEGKSTKYIADNLHLSHHTIYTHRKNVMKKLGINSASELILYAINSGIVDTPQGDD